MEISSDDLNEKIISGKKVIVEFWAEWCGPCRMMKPIFEKVSNENSTEVEMYTMNVDNNRDFSVKYGIRNIPTVKIFDKKEVVETRVGVLNEDSIKNLVKTLLLN
jgi:thioredoxin 1